MTEFDEQKIKVVTKNKKGEKLMNTQERLKILKDLNVRPEFKDRFIELYGIKEPEVCTCRYGDKCTCIGKHPNYFDNWQKHHINSNEEFYEILKERPNANFGIKTGNGLVVIDVDTKDNGFESLEQIKQYMPDTFTVRTGSGGLHFFYSTDREIKNRTRFMDGLDVRGDGGYVVAPASRHKCGNYYLIEKDTKIQPITRELLEIITTDTPKEESEYRHIETTDTFGEGERHDKMVKIAGNFYRQGLSEKVVLEALQSMNETLCNPPLPYKEIKSITKSVAKYKNAERNPDLQTDKKDIREKILKTLLSSKGNKDERNYKASKLFIDDISKYADLIIGNNNNCYLMPQDSNNLIYIHENNIKFKELLNRRYGINPATPIFKYLIQSLVIYCYQHAKKVDVYKFAYYDYKNNILYVICNENEIYKIDTNDIIRCANGTDGVLFSDELAPEPFEYNPDREKIDYIDKYLLSPYNYDDEVLDNKIQKSILKGYFLSCLMPEFLPTKPILTVIGVQGSGKTTLLRSFIQTLFGSKHDVTIMPSKLDDLDIVVSNSYFLVLDNLDTHVKGLNDKLAVYSTGGYVMKRKLYSDGELFQVKVNSFIGISTLYLVFRRNDVMQRLLIVQLNPIRNNGYITDKDFIRTIFNNRNNILSQAIEEIQKVMRIIEKKKYKDYTSSFRMADFAQFFALVLDNPKQAEEYLEYMKKVQINKAMDSDSILPYLAAFISVAKDGFYTANQVYNYIIEILNRTKQDISKARFSKNEFEKQYENVQSFAKRLNNIKYDIKDFIIIETRQARSNLTEYRFKAGEKFNNIEFVSLIDPNVILDKVV